MTSLPSRAFPAIVVDARHARAAMGAQRNKTDRNDAQGIAQMMRMGWYRAVHVKSPESQRLRMLLANRRLLKRKLIDMENHIRGTLRAFGLRVGQVSRGRFEARIRDLLDESDEGLEAFIVTMLTGATEHARWFTILCTSSFLISSGKTRCAGGS